MLPERSVAFTIIGMDELEISPSVALCLLKREPGVVTQALVRVLVPAVGSCHHHKLWHRFGQHAPVLLAFFDFLFSLFLVLDVGAGAKPLDDLTGFIAHGHASRQEPAIAPCFALLETIIDLIGFTCCERMMPDRHGLLIIVRM